MRVADYPTIQDYVGEAVMDTNACRVFVISVAQAMDRATDDNTRVLKPGETARADYLHWAWQIKFEAAKNTAQHVDKMLHACGGSGYKRDMELERYVRDAKAGWVMGPTNEVLRQFVGKAVLNGFDSLDYWNQNYNRRVVENEVKKLDSAGKRELARAAGRAGREGREDRAGEGIGDGDRARPVCWAAGLKPVDRSLRVALGAARGGDRRAAAPGRRAHRRQPGRRPGRGADGARHRGRRGRGGDRRPQPTSRRACCAG